MGNGYAPIAITTTPADVVRRWIGEATRAGYGDQLVTRMADSIGGTTGDVHAIARASLPHMAQLLDGDLVQRLAGSVGASPLALSYRTVLRYDLAALPEALDDDEERAEMDEEEQPRGMDEDDRRPRYRFVMSDAAPDRADDIVEQSWDLSEFRQTPVAPYNHDYSAPPIGRWEGVEASEGVLRGTLVPTPVESYPLSMTVAALLEQGVLRTVSVGFRPSAVIARASLPEDDSRHSTRGSVYVLPRLMEASVTPMPMNPRAALARAATVAPVARSMPAPSTGLPWSAPVDDSDRTGLPWT
jgi:hypothetical protein